MQYMKKFKITTLLFFASLSGANKANMPDSGQKRKKQNPISGGFGHCLNSNVINSKN